MWPLTLKTRLFGSIFHSPSASCAIFYHFRCCIWSDPFDHMIQRIKIHLRKSQISTKLEERYSQSANPIQLMAYFLIL